MDVHPLTEELRRLVEAARAVSAAAYVPYSGFRVGAAALGANGRIYTGCNVENSSYPVTLCAERNAVGSAVAAGETRVAAVAVASPDDLDDLTPCGMCRQFMAEFGDDVLVVFRQGGVWRVQPVNELLPGTFRLRES
ncbi:MAG: cytidine deaminase [Thermoleophilia bacterium]